MPKKMLICGNKITDDPTNIYVCENDCDPEGRFLVIINNNKSVIENKPNIMSLVLNFLRGVSTKKKVSLSIQPYMAQWEPLLSGLPEIGLLKNLTELKICLKHSSVGESNKIFDTMTNQFLPKINYDKLESLELKGIQSAYNILHSFKKMPMLKHLTIMNCAGDLNALSKKVGVLESLTVSMPKEPTKYFLSLLGTILRTCNSIDLTFSLRGVSVYPVLLEHLKKIKRLHFRNMDLLSVHRIFFSLFNKNIEIYLDLTYFNLDQLTKVMKCFFNLTNFEYYKFTINFRDNLYVDLTDLYLKYEKKFDMTRKLVIKDSYMRLDLAQRKRKKICMFILLESKITRLNQKCPMKRLPYELFRMISEFL